MPATETPTIRQQTDTLSGRLGKLIAQAKTGAASSADFKAVKTQALELANQIDASDTPSDDDGYDADRLLMLAESATGWIKAVEASHKPARHQTAGDGFTDRPPHRRGYKTKGGEPVAVLAKGEALADWYAASGRVPEPSALGDEPMPRVGEVVKAVISGDWSGAPQMSSALSGGQHTAGGYMLTPAVASQIIDRARAQSVVFQAGARTVDMPTSELRMVKVDTDPAMSWIGENERFPRTRPVFGSLTFRARKMGTIIPISKELVADAPNAADEIENLLGIAAAQELDRVVLLGDGNGEEPVGLFNITGPSENDISGAVDWDEVLDSAQAIEDQNGIPRTLVYPPAVKKALAALKVNAEANHYALPPAALDDLQRLTTTKLANAQALLGDFQQVMVGIRSGVEIVATDRVATSDGAGFESDQVLVKLRWRGDVQFAHPAHFEKLTNIS